MKTAEIASQYGVPTPETCIELKWENINTNFFWLVCNNTQMALLHIIQENRFGEKCYHPVNSGFAHNKFKIYPAPQFHEIARLLPPFSNCSYQTIYQKTMKNELIYSENVEERICILVENGNIAQAAAELYLKI